jgi:hypothetical protein
MLDAERRTVAILERRVIVTDADLAATDGT